MNALFTIDTDCAAIRVYPARARAAGMTDRAIDGMIIDLHHLAAGVSKVAGAIFRVELSLG